MVYLKTINMYRYESSYDWSTNIPIGSKEFEDARKVKWLKFDILLIINGMSVAHILELVCEIFCFEIFRIIFHRFKIDEYQIRTDLER